jgi:hypothetical protein
MVTITGTNLGANPTILFNGTPATVLGCTKGTQCTAIVPAGTGRVPIVAHTDYGWACVEPSSGPCQPFTYTESGVSAAWTPDGKALYVVANGANGVYEKHWTASSGYSGWNNLGGQTLDAPSVAWAPNGQAMYIVIRGTDGLVRESHWTAATGYTAFAPLGGDQMPIVSAPSVAWNPQGTAMYVAARGVDNVL